MELSPGQYGDSGHKVLYTIYFKLLYKAYWHAGINIRTKKVKHS